MLLKGSRGLVISYSSIERDPRVRRQLDWLSSVGAEITAAGFRPHGPAPLKRFVELGQAPLPNRLRTYVFSSHELRSQRLAVTPEITVLLGEISDSKFDFVILNDLDLAGCDELFQACSSTQTAIIWDLHEYFPDLGGGLFWKLTQERYHKWLLERLQTRSIDSFMTVSDDIGDLYERHLGIRPATVVNCPDLVGNFREDFVSRPDSKEINLLYHGAVGKGRGLFRLIRAMRSVRAEFSLTVIPTGPRLRVLVLKIWSRLRKSHSRVRFLKPVRFDRIREMLRGYDLQVLFYHPPHSTNEKYALPNKLFESLSGGLGLITGESPSMKRIVENFGCGIVVNGWKATNLSAAINELNRDRVERIRQASLEAASQFGSGSNGKYFLAVVAMVVSRKRSRKTNG